MYNEEGLDIPALRAHVAAGGLLKDFPGGTGACRLGKGWGRREEWRGGGGAGTSHTT